MSAIALIHEARGHTRQSQYVEVCVSCVQLFAAGDRVGCRDHINAMAINRRGNPKNCTMVKQEMENSSRDGANYRSQGQRALLPHHVSSMVGIIYFNVESLVAKNDLKHFQFAVMVLFQVLMGFRFDDIAGLTIASFEQVAHLNQFNDEGFPRYE